MQDLLIDSTDPTQETWTPCPGGCSSGARGKGGGAEAEAELKASVPRDSQQPRGAAGTDSCYNSVPYDLPSCSTNLSAQHPAVAVSLLARLP